MIEDNINLTMLEDELSKDPLYALLLEQSREETFLLLDQMFNEDGFLKNNE